MVECCSSGNKHILISVTNMRSESIIFILISLTICIYGQKDLDSPCIVEATKSSGTCTLLENCPSVLDDVKRHVFLHTRCVPFAANGTEIVCCPEVKSTTTENPQEKYSFSRISEKVCYEHKSITMDEQSGEKIQADKCESKSVPIIPSSLASHEKYPHMAYVGYFTKTGELLWLCSGVLLNVRYVMSPAHCGSSEHGGAARIRVGELHENSEDDSYADNHLIALTVTHPEYSRSSAYNDIILYLLAPHVNLGRLKRPACLPSATFDSEKSKVIFTGLRQDNETGTVISRLRQSTVEIGSTKDCNDLYTNQTTLKLLDQGIKSETQICVDTTDSESDSVDSDGVLQVYHPEQKCMFVVIGMATFGITQPSENSNAPSIFTRIHPYVDWIENVVWK